MARCMGHTEKSFYIKLTIIMLNVCNNHENSNAILQYYSIPEGCKLFFIKC